MMSAATRAFSIIAVCNSLSSPPPKTVTSQYAAIRRREECAGTRSKISDPKARNGFWIGPVEVESCNAKLSK